MARRHVAGAAVAIDSRGPDLRSGPGAAAFDMDLVLVAAARQVGAVRLFRQSRLAGLPCCERTQPARRAGFPLELVRTQSLAPESVGPGLLVFWRKTGVQSAGDRLSTVPPAARVPFL